MSSPSNIQPSHAARPDFFCCAVRSAKRCGSLEGELDTGGKSIVAAALLAGRIAVERHGAHRLGHLFCTTKDVVANGKDVVTRNAPLHRANAYHHRAKQQALKAGDGPSGPKMLRGHRAEVC